ncbi:MULTISPECIES: hypothetical protein [Aeromonas]|uniref:hypothetical protein n=1 Tax=Aeromonas TaxID=642 RepID=UPI000B07FBDF|nr:MULTISPECIES: hypothetical protein [Aeromonas]MBS4641973.1 hypothetical protein [Aeromonas media]
MNPYQKGREGVRGEALLKINQQHLARGICSPFSPSCKCNQVALAPSVCETALGESKRQCWNEVFGGKNDGSI